MLNDFFQLSIFLKIDTFPAIEASLVFEGILTCSSEGSPGSLGREQLLTCKN